MAKKDVSFFAPSNERTSPEARRRDALAEMLAMNAQPSKTEVISGYVVPQGKGDGLAKALSMGLSGYQAGQAERAEQTRKDSARTTLASAMEAYNRSQMGGTEQLPNGESVTWNTQSPQKSGSMYANLLMQNEDTAPMGMQTMMGQMQTQMDNANELDMYKQKFPMELELARAKAEIAQRYAKPESGGATGYLVEKVMQDNPGTTFTEALYSVQTGMRQGLGMNDGQVAAIPGVGVGKGEIAKTEKYMETVGKEGAELDVANQAALPAQEASAEALLKNLEGLIAHPGLKYAVGKSSVLPIIPGTDAADFQVRLDQIKGDQFLQAYNDLRGGGSITEPEGRKAEAAKARMDKAQTEAEFKASAQEFADVVRAGLQRKQSGTARFNPTVTTNPAVNTPVDQIQPAMSAEQMGGGSVPQITSDAEYDALPPNSVFIGPDGQQRRKP